MSYDLKNGSTFCKSLISLRIFNVSEEIYNWMEENAIILGSELNEETHYKRVSDCGNSAYKPSKHWENIEQTKA